MENHSNKMIYVPVPWPLWPKYFKQFISSSLRIVGSRILKLYLDIVVGHFRIK